LSNRLLKKDTRVFSLNTSCNAFKSQWVLFPAARCGLVIPACAGVTALTADEIPRSLLRGASLDLLPFPSCDCIMITISQTVQPKIMMVAIYVLNCDDPSAFVPGSAIWRAGFWGSSFYHFLDLTESQRLAKTNQGLRCSF
jgi:hypothetical protein